MPSLANIVKVRVCSICTKKIGGEARECDDGHPVGRPTKDESYFIELPLEPQLKMVIEGSILIIIYEVDRTWHYHKVINCCDYEFLTCQRLLPFLFVNYKGRGGHELKFKLWQHSLNVRLDHDLMYSRTPLFCILRREHPIFQYNKKLIWKGQFQCNKLNWGQPKH